MNEEVRNYLSMLNSAIREAGGEHDPRAQELVRERTRLVDLLAMTEPMPTIEITGEQWALIQRNLRR